MQIKYGAGVQTAPGVYTREIDRGQSVPAGASSSSALAGVFSWGPVDEPRLIDSENQLASVYGAPNNNNFETFFVAASYLAYARNLYINRVNDGGLSAVANSGAVVSMEAHTVNNDEDYEDKVDSFESTVDFIARYPGELGNSLRLSACASSEQYASTIDLANLDGNTSFADSNTEIAFTVGSNTATITLANTAALDSDTPEPFANTVATKLTAGDYLTVGNNSIGTQEIKIASIGNPVIVEDSGANTGYATIQVNLEQPVKIATDYSASTIERSWEFKGAVDKAPATTFSVQQSGNSAATDGVHVVVVDEDGKFTNRPGSILEVFENVSRATDAQNIDGVDNYIKNVINQNSSFIRYGSGAAALPTTTGALVEDVASDIPYNISLVDGTNGNDESTAAIAAIAAGYDVFADSELYPISGIIAGKTRGGANGEQIFNNIIDNVAEVRRDIVAFGSPARTAVVGNSNPLNAVVAFRDAVRSSSYAALDSGYKYMYDKYNNTYRHVPLCGDTAGISSRTDFDADPWAPPAGFNRGQIKNIVKLTWNPRTADQAVLFPNDINPVVTSRGDGTYVMGDKTLIGYQTPLNEIGVRKMFNIIKRNIAEASKRLLFEFNDEFTQARFRNLVEPYLRNIQGRSGITSFRVVCDDTNNTLQVKNSNQFVGDLEIRPNRSIRTIHLNFVNDNGVSTFTEQLV